MGNSTSQFYKLTICASFIIIWLYVYRSLIFFNVFLSAHQKLGLTLPLTQRLDHVTPTALDLIACTHCSVIPDPKQFYLCDNCDVCICKDCATFDSDADLGLQKLSLQGNGDPRSHSAACQCALPKLRRAPPKILEVLLEMTAWTCENAERGCTEVIRWSNLEKHAKYCKYRKFWKNWWTNQSLI